MYKLTNIVYKSGDGPKEYVISEVDYFKYSGVTFLNKKKEIERVSLNQIIYLVIREKTGLDIVKCDIQDANSKNG